MTKTQRRVLLGRINAAYGLKGWVKVFSYTDPPEEILKYNPWSLRRRNVDKQVKVEQGRKHGKGLVARLVGAEDRDHAEALVGNEIWGELPDLGDGDYYWHRQSATFQRGGTIRCCNHGARSAAICNIATY